MTLRIPKRRLLLPAVAVGAALLAAGCIISGQFVITFALNKTIHSTDTVMDYVFVDLTDNSTWKDHEDDIQGIVDVKFEVRFKNNLGTQTTGEVYISAGDTKHTTVGDVQANATRILSGIVLAGGESQSISFSESAQFIENLSTVLDLLETGKFYIYGIADSVPFDITIDGVSGQSFGRLLVTFSAG